MPPRFMMTLAALLLLGGSVPSVGFAEPNDVAAEAPSAEEARARARLLHETVHATLQYVHHEYYREDEGLKIPAATLGRVFRELAERQKVQLRWLAVDGEAMNTDHKPQDEFEKQAAAAIASGKDEYEQVESGMYRRAAAITLGSECLKCHFPTRKSSEDRSAGLIIAIPFAKP
jgi:hypothetical protein